MPGQTAGGAGTVLAGGTAVSWIGSLPVASGAAAGGASAGAGSGSPAAAADASGGAGAAAGRGRGAMSVTLVAAPSDVQAGLVVIVVPAGTATAGHGLRVPLPAVIADALRREGSAPAVTLADGAPLPAWLRLAPGADAVLIGAVPQGGLPVTLRLAAGATATTLQISEAAAD